MTNKGTGWVPDFPDVKDYTLGDQKVQDLTIQVQTDEVMKSREEMTEQITQVLKLLQLQSQSKDSDDQKTTEKERKLLGNDEKIEDLIKKIDKKSAGGIFFANIQLPAKVLEKGMYDGDVLRVKKYLISIYPDFDKIQYNSPYGSDPTFDDLTKSLIEDFQTTRNLRTDGRVDTTTMEALKWASHVMENIDSDDNDFENYYNYYLSEENNAKVIAIIKNLQEFKKEKLDVSYESGLRQDEKVLLKEAIVHLKESRKAILELLNGNKIQIAPIVEKWLGDYEDRMDKELKRLQDSELSNSSLGFTDPLSTEVEYFILQLRTLPSTLPVPANPAYNYEIKKVKNIDFPIPQQLFGSTLKRLFSDQALIEINQLIEPVLWSEFQPFSTDTVLVFYSRESYGRRLQSDSDKKLNKQLDVLGIHLKREIRDGRYKVQERIEEFVRLNNLTDIAHKLAYEKTGIQGDNIGSHEEAYNFGEHYYTFVFGEIATAVQSKVNQYIYPIVEAIFRIITPLGMQNNFELAIEQGFQIFEALLGFQGIFLKKQEDGIKISKEEAINEVNILDKIKEISSIDNYEYFTDISLTAIYKISALIDSDCQKIELIASASRSPIALIMEKVVDYKLIKEEIVKIQKSRTIPPPSRQRLLLGGIGSTNQGNFQADLRVPIDWEFYQGIKNDYPENTVKEGERGSDVIRLQELLKSAGFNVGVTDGIFGPLTLQAVQDFQSSRNMTRDGVVGVATWKALVHDVSIYLKLPDFVDLSLWCSPIEDQGSINSCTAHAGVALIEYFSKKTFGKYTDVSPLFLYKTARNLMQRQGDSGASVRETMKAMVLFGIPPEEYWPYNEEHYDEEPSTFCYSFAENYQALKYFRLDYAGIAQDALLIQIKAVLLAGFPCMFGFTIYSSIYDESNVERGYIPYPSKLDKMEGGHAVVAVGYDDNRVIQNADGKRSEGAILIRNSWGTDWGKGGYGWLPYDYILAGLTADWWSLLKSEWFESGKFGAGATHWKSSSGGRSKPGYP